MLRQEPDDGITVSNEIPLSDKNTEEEPEKDLSGTSSLARVLLGLCVTVVAFGLVYQFLGGKVLIARFLTQLGVLQPHAYSEVNTQV